VLNFVYQREDGEYLGIVMKYKPKVSFKDVAIINKPE